MSRNPMLVMLLLLAPFAARAAIYTVGPSASACTHATVQAAVDAAAANLGPDEIHISAPAGGFPAQAIVVQDAALAIHGGYADCGAGLPTQRTLLTGDAGMSQPILTIDGPCIAGASLADIHLDHLDLRDGHAGGLLVSGCASVDLSASLIADNVAVAGGGIAVFRQGDVMPMLFVGDDVRIENNSATNGGGIYVWSAYLRIGGSGTIVRGNHVSGDDAGGGGIAVLGSDPPWQALVEIVSGGADGAGIISANHAQLGGGLYLGHGSMVQLYTTDPAQPVRIDHNDAFLGGAVFVNGTMADASIIEGAIDSNTSTLGGAAVAAWNGGRFTMRSSTASGVPVDAVACATPGTCNRVSGNVAASAGAPMPGAIALLDNGDATSRSEVHFQSTHLLANSGSSLFADRCHSAGCSHPVSVEISNSRIVANPGAARLLEMGSGSGSHFGCDLCTITGFAASSEPLLDTNGELILSRSIQWQPGRDIIGGRTPSYVGADSLQLHDRADFPSSAFQNIEVGDPRFVAPETGDFRLGVNSPALDRADVSALPPFDLDGHARAVDQPAVPDHAGVVDLGAYERVDDGASSDTIFASGFD